MLGVDLRQNQTLIRADWFDAFSDFLPENPAQRAWEAHMHSHSRIR
jgi:hypothetical protein